MAEMTLIQAITDALRIEMRSNPDVVILGEDVGRNGGVFRATDGLQAEFGEERVMDTPLCESGIIGAAIGQSDYGPTTMVSNDAALRIKAAHLGVAAAEHRLTRSDRQSAAIGWTTMEAPYATIDCLYAAGAIVGASLGNDVNLRDFEGRSALLLCKAKDNNASCAIGPFIRLLDDGFRLDDLRQAEITLTIAGNDGFDLDGKSEMTRISRDIEALANQTLNRNHQYPDGAALFTGTAFAPTKDRDTPDEGFTHKLGDLVTISSPKLGALVNRVTTSDKAAPWEFGAAALMRNLAARGVL